MAVWLSVTVLFAAAGRPMAPRPPALQPRPRTVSARPAAGDFSLTVSPATVTFTATNPDSAAVASGGAGASVSWQSRDGKAGTWSLGNRQADGFHLPFEYFLRTKAFEQHVHL